MTRQTGELFAQKSLPLVEPQFSSHYILAELRNAGLKGRKVDFLCVFKDVRLPILNPVLSRYIDEVQDNLLIDTLSTSPPWHLNLAYQTFSVLRTLCNNQHGLFWAGDTAQVSDCFLKNITG